MSNKNTESIATALQNLTEEWASQFEVKPPVELSFHTTSNNLLAINGVVLAPVADIDAEASTYDVEYLHIMATDGSYFEIYLDWSEDGVCRIGYIKRIQTIYCAAQ